MNQKEKISFEDICGQSFRIRIFEDSENGKAALTHYLHNNKNGVSEFFKTEAVNQVKAALEYKYPDVLGASFNP